MYIYINLIRAILIIAGIYHIYKKDYKSFMGAIIAFVLTFLLMLLEKINIKMDTLGDILYITILFMSIYLGGVLKFYDKFSWWDRIIHVLAGIDFISFGITLARKVEHLNNFQILLFSLTLAISLHVIWEIVEYIVDSISHSDHQRWQKRHETNNHVSKSAIEPPGLVDTMNDTIISLLGSLSACILWWFIL